jgi:hypothetical protein
MLKNVILPIICIFISTASIPANTTMDMVNWEKGAIIAYGSSEIWIKNGKPIDIDDGLGTNINHGRLIGYKKAHENAYKKIISLIKDIRVDSNNSFSDLINNNPITQARLNRILNTKLKIIDMPINFMTSGCLAELKIRDIIPAIPCQYPNDDFPIILNNPIPTVYTSLIVDTRNLDIEPMIFPSVLNEEGLEIYARQFIESSRISRSGMVSYVSTEKEAMKHKKAGDRPLFTIAVKGINGCPVISNKDTRKILSSDGTISHLKQCRVIFIIDRKTKTE